MIKKKLPIGIQSFAALIEGDYVYVDKTSYIYRLVDEGMFYFLSRPRRFGKSLLVSTLKALFEGRSELFKGLWIENSGWEWKTHPVVQIDFNGIDVTDAKTLETDLIGVLDDIAREHELPLLEETLSRKFVRVLTDLFQKYSAKVVVLVDEYDKPIITHLGAGEAGLHTPRAPIAPCSKNFSAC